MDRRTLVRITSGVGLGFLAGCLGAADDSSDGDGETAGNETETTETELETEAETTNETETNGGDDVLEDDTELTFETLESGPFEAITTTALDDAADKGDDEKADDEEPIGEEATVYHRIRIENASNRDRDLSIRIDRDGTTVLEGTNELSAETALEIIVGEPGAYETTLEAGGIRNTSSISRSGAPCEESRTVVTFTDGGIETNTTTSC